MSWTDEVPSFAPYVEQQNVSAMAAVGSQREARFEKGIETVNSIYDSFLSLPIAKGVTQEYVKQKVGQLNNAVKQSISGDFSDRRLINQIGGLASQISNDPIVENGVKSTAAIQSGLAQMKADQETNAKNGKNPVYNVADYQDAINAWMSDGKIETSFNGSYTPYVDVIDRAIKMFKEQNPGDNVGRDSFYVDENGKTQVNPTMREGVDPNRIQNVLNLVYQQPDVQQQLVINGRQKYKGITPVDMAELLTTAAEQEQKGIKTTIDKLQMKLSTDSTVDATAVTNEINQLKELSNQLVKEYNDNTGILLSSNPDALKTKLAKQEITSNFIGAYSYEKLKKNPLWESTMESLKYELDLVKNSLDVEKFKFDKLEKNRRFDLDQQRELRLLTGKKTDANGNPIPDGGDVFSITGNTPENSGKMGSGTFNTLYDEANADLAQLTLESVHSLYIQGNHQQGDFNPVKLDPATGTYTYNVDPSGVSGYKSLGEAKSKYENTYIEMRGNLASGTATEEVKKALQKVAPQIQYVQAITAKKKELDSKRDAVISTIRNQVGDFNPDYVDAYAVENKLADWESSETRLKQKYGPNWLTSMDAATTTAATNGKYGTINTSDPSNSVAAMVPYNQFKKKFDKTLAASFQQVEGEYRSSQLALLPINSVLTGSKAEDKEISRTKYSNVSSSIAQGNKAYEDFRDMLEPDKGDKYKANIYGAQWDPLEKKYYLTVTRGGEQGNKIAKIEVTRDEFESIPQFKSDNQFWNKFGDILSITNKTTTDVANGGYATAYPMERLVTSPYQVGYHVVSVGSNLYNLKLYIKDKKGNDILNTTAGLAASPAALMDAISQFENRDDLIEALIKQRK